jgi:hypothetical protein
MPTLIITPSITAGAGLDESVTPPYPLSGVGVQEYIIPHINALAGVTEKTTPALALRAGIIERVGLSAIAQAGITEQLNVYITLQGGIVEVLAPAAALSAEFYSFIMNTKTGGFAEYTNFPFTSLFRVGTMFLGIAPDGLYQHTGKTDNGKQIDAELLTGISNLGVNQRKHPIDAWLEMRGSGDVEVTLVFDEDWKEASEYTETCDNDLQIGFQRVKLARGDDGTHLQVRFKNIDGSDFDLRTIRIPYEILSRISGGKK